MKLSGIQPLIDGWHLIWMKYWSHRKRYSIYGPSHLDYALKIAQIEHRQRNNHAN